ncbi:MAG: radical SAM protein [bacterium]
MEKIDKLIKLVDFSGNDSFRHYDAAKKAMFHKKNFTSFLAGKYSSVKPICVEIVPSLDCNFMCPNCTYAQNKSKLNKGLSARFLTKKVFNRMMKELESFDVKSVIFTGGGEPAMNPNLIEYMKVASKKFDVGLYTNGLLWDEEKIEKVLRLNPAFVRISINAGTSDVHSKVFGYNNKILNTGEIFEKVKNNIIKFGEKKKELGVNTLIGLGIIINEKNYADISNIFSLVDELNTKSNCGIDYAAFRPEVYYFGSNLEACKIQPNAGIFKKIKLDSFIKKYKKSNVELIFNEEGFRSLSKPYKEEKNIAASWSVSFNYDGKLYFTSEHNGMESYYIGDIMKTSLVEIWKGKHRMNLLNSATTLPNFKLKSLNELLFEIKKLGKFSRNEISEFYKKYKGDKESVHNNFI